MKKLKSLRYQKLDPIFPFDVEIRKMKQVQSVSQSHRSIERYFFGLIYGSIFETRKKKQKSVAPALHQILHTKVCIITFVYIYIYVI